MICWPKIPRTAYLPPFHLSASAKITPATLCDAAPAPSLRVFTWLSGAAHPQQVSSPIMTHPGTARSRFLPENVAAGCSSQNSGFFFRLRSEGKRCPEVVKKSCADINTHREARTHDHKVKSLALYRLS